MSDRLKISLLEDYFALRPALRRFLLARLGDEQLADDILQDMYLKLDRTVLKSPVGNSSAFLYRVASNLVLDHRKAAARRRVRDHNWSDSQLTMVGAEPVQDMPDADTALDARRRLDRLAAAIQELPLKCRTIFKACKIQGMTHRQAADHHGISVGTVEKHISRALKHLLQYAGSDNDDD